MLTQATKTLYYFIKQHLFSFLLSLLLFSLFLFPSSQTTPTALTDTFNWNNRQPDKNRRRNFILSIYCYAGISLSFLWSNSATLVGNVWPHLHFLIELLSGFLQDWTKKFLELLTSLVLIRKKKKFTFKCLLGRRGNIYSVYHKIHF